MITVITTILVLAAIIAVIVLGIGGFLLIVAAGILELLFCIILSPVILIAIIIDKLFL